ncbi:MAG TPA: hypothetical protein VFP58_14980 [Candidatus Eisenbacteria bacterium]|nr:hypothetical protein [Candidatus Eisenbacteria bacterium]
MLHGPAATRRSPARPSVLPVLLALATAWAGGCSYTSQVREKDDTFTRDALLSGTAVVVSVVQVDEMDHVRAPFVDALERVLRATRPDVKLVPHARAAAALDDSTSRVLLLGYQMHGEVDPVWMGRAAASLRSVARYGILARVEEVVTRRVDRTDPSTNPDLRSPTGMVRVTGQDARVSVHVYDLESRARVFSGTYWGTSEVALSEGEDMPPRESETDEIDVSSPYDSTSSGLFLKTPPLVRSLEPAFLEFARSLPGGPAR